ncbi:hypothetical protein V6473_003086 [Vibrio parahaemolyticus]
MSLLISRQGTPQKRAKWLLAMIGWVIVVCLMQNSGLVSACSMSDDQTLVSALSSNDAHAVKADKVKEPSKCELSEKLIQFTQHQLEAFIVVLFIGIVLAAVWRCSAFVNARQWTEPIYDKHRIHLTFCVFRE